MFKDKDKLIDEYDLPGEPWKNTACLGYAISALESLGYAPEKINEVIIELKELFDWVSVDDAEDTYNNSNY